MINESEGMLIKIRNEAQATKQRQIMEAEGEAAAIRVRAEAQAQAIETVAKVCMSLYYTRCITLIAVVTVIIFSQTLESYGASHDAARLYVAKDYITMMGDMGSNSNTMIFSDKPGNTHLHSRIHMCNYALNVSNAYLYTNVQVILML